MPLGVRGRLATLGRLAFAAAELQAAFGALKGAVAPLHVGVTARARLLAPVSERTDSTRRSSSTCSKPSRSRMGRDIGPAPTASAGVPRATTASQRARTTARYAPRPRAHSAVAPPIRNPPTRVRTTLPTDA